MAPIFDKIVAHPFIRELIDGSLPEQAFVRYLAQDAFYLHDYARCWAMLAAHSPQPAWVLTFCGNVASSVKEEEAMQAELLREMGYQRDDVIARSAPTPTGLAFKNFITDACGNGGFHQGYAALLECPWAYWELGKVLKQEGSASPVYQKWIDWYVGGEAAAENQALLDIWEQVAADLGPKALQSCEDYAFKAVRYDWMFWDCVYRDEQWPVGGGLCQPHQ